MASATTPTSPSPKRSRSEEPAWLATAREMLKDKITVGASVAIGTSFGKCQCGETVCAQPMSDLAFTINRERVRAFCRTCGPEAGFVWLSPITHTPMNWPCCPCGPLHYLGINEQHYLKCWLKDATRGLAGCREYKQLGAKPSVRHEDCTLCADPITGRPLTRAHDPKLSLSTPSDSVSASSVGIANPGAVEDGVPVTVVYQTDGVLLVCLPATKVAVSNDGMLVTFSNRKDDSTSALGEFSIDNLLLWVSWAKFQIGS